MTSWFDTARATVSPDLGIDLGTANTVVYDRTAGVIVAEPTMAAYDVASEEIVAVGGDARAMEGRSPRRFRVVRPISRGTISDFRAAHAIVERLTNRALASRPRVLPRLVTSVPGCATDIECKAVEAAMRAAGARSMTFVTQAVAAAVGAGLRLADVRAQMVVDIGGGTTEIAIIGLCGIIRLRSLVVGGDHLDEAIRRRLGNERFAVSRQEAERLKIGLGYVGRPPGRQALRAAGLDQLAGLPSWLDVDEQLVAEAIAAPMGQIVRAIQGVIESAPPEVAADLVESGLTLTGGGALLTGLAGELGARTNLPTVIAPDPLLCVARGAGEILASPTLLERLRPSTDRLTRWYQSLRIATKESYSP